MAFCGKRVVFFHLWLPDWLSFMKGRHTEVIEGLQLVDDEWIVKERDGTAQQ